MAAAHAQHVRRSTEWEWTTEASEIRSGLLSELAASQARLVDWLEGPSFGRPTRPVIADPTFKTWPLAYVATVMQHFMVRTAWNVHAIQLLCREGMAVQAQPILRAVMESTIDARYISTNPQVLVTKWCLHEETLRYKYWATQPESSRPPDFGFAQRSVNNRLRLLDRRAPKSNGKPWKLADVARDWDLTTLKSRDDAACEALGPPEERVHDIYKLLCGPLHGSTQAANDFVVALGEGKFEFVSGLADRKLVFVPFFSLYSLSVLMRAAVRCGALGCESIEPDWAAVGASGEELAAAASADFRYASFGA